MNNKGIKFLALAMVLAVAFSAVAVISSSDDASAAGESTYDATTKKLTLGTDITTVTSSQNIEMNHAYFINNTSPVTLTIPSGGDASMETPIIIFIKDSAPLVTIDNKCDTDFNPATGEPFLHAVVYAIYMVSEKNGNVLTLTNGLKADNLSGSTFVIGHGVYGENSIGDTTTWLRGPQTSSYTTYDGHIYRQGNFNNSGLLGYYTGTGKVQQFGPYDESSKSYPSTELSEIYFFQKSGSFLGDAHWDAEQELANQAYDTFTLTNFTGKLTQINRVVTIDSWTGGDIEITKADSAHKVVLKAGLTIPAGSKLTIDASTYVTIAGNLTNGGTFLNNGNVTNNGTILNKGEITGIGTIEPSVVKVYISVPTVSGGKVTFTDSQFVAEGTPINRASETAINGILSVEVEDGYVFGGWDVTITSTGEEYLGDAVPSSAITMVPMITKQSAYTVAFIVDDNVYMALSVEPGKPVMKPADPSKEGNKFIGWFDEQNERWDFSKPVSRDMVLTAKWDNKMYVTVPEGGDQFTVVVTTPEPGPAYAYNSEFSFTLANGAGYTISKVYAGTLDITAQGDETGGIYSFIVKGDTSVKVTVMKGETATESSQSKVDNDDGSQTVIDTSVVKEAGAATKIEETATTTGGTSAGTTTVKAEVSETTAAVEFTNVTGTDNAVVSESMVAAITDAVGFGGEVTMDVTASTSTVTIPKAALNNNQISEVTVSFNTGAQNSATITLPKDVLADANLGQTISIGVEDATSQPSTEDLGTSATGAVFDLNIYGTATTEFDNPVTVSYDVDLPSGAFNVRFFCVDDGSSVPADYASGTATGTLEHFSTWAIVYDLHIDVIIDDGDELPPTWNYVPQQQSSSSNTTMIVAACAAAVAAIAVALVMLNVVRKN